MLAGMFAMVVASGVGGRPCFAQEAQSPDEVVPARPYPEQVNPAPPNVILEIPATESSPREGSTEASAPVQPAKESPSVGIRVPAPAPEQPPKPENFDVIADPNKTPVANDTANLLRLANNLKTEVDKTTPDTLSVTVVRQANEIEKLAHKMRTK
jgi:hypothetical protein